MLTKDQIQKLPPEQQEAFAQLLVQHVQSRQRILERARRYRGMGFIGGGVMGLGYGLAILSFSMPRALPFAIMVVSISATIHAAGLNRRVDALMELLETDIKRATEMVKSNDDGAV